MQNSLRRDGPHPIVNCESHFDTLTPFSLISLIHAFPPLSVGLSEGFFQQQQDSPAKEVAACSYLYERYKVGE